MNAHIFTDLHSIYCLAERTSSRQPDDSDKIFMLEPGSQANELHNMKMKNKQPSKFQRVHRVVLFCAIHSIHASSTSSTCRSSTIYHLSTVQLSSWLNCTCIQHLISGLPTCSHLTFCEQNNICIFAREQWARRT